MSFKTFWAKLLTNLKPRDMIKNWTTANGYLGDEFEIHAVSDAAVQVESPNAETIQRVAKSEFELMYSNWEGYCSGRIQRQVLRDQTRFSKYTISIIKHLESLQA